MLIKKRNRLGILHRFMLMTAFLLFWGCAHHHPLPEERYQLAYKSDGSSMQGSERWSPSFIVYGHSRNYNRIGGVSAAKDDKPRQKIFIDTENPTIYFMKRSFETEKAIYTNHIYRVHFPKIPYSLIPFNLTAGKNVGLMVVVTLNTENLPILVTTVHTCGCYKAIVPTQYLPKDALPEKWAGGRLNVYGEKLPALLQVQSMSSPQIMVHLRPSVHRVMNLEVRDTQVMSSRRYKVVSMRPVPMEHLKKLSTNNGSTSFYHSAGVLKGYVKGSVKPLETLFMSLISLDFFVGTDKIYADAAETGNTFYTSLKPWRRDDSDMWNFGNFLTYWGWRL
jgi:hypothetical protein